MTKVTLQNEINYFFIVILLAIPPKKGQANNKANKTFQKEVIVIEDSGREPSSCLFNFYNCCHGK